MNQSRRRRKVPRSRDLRKYAQQTTNRLIIGFFLLVFIIGDGLIFLILGRDAAIMGLICLLTATAPLLIIWLVLLIMDRVVKRWQDE